MSIIGHPISCGWLSETIFACILPKNQISADFMYIENIQSRTKVQISPKSDADQGNKKLVRKGNLLENLVNKNSRTAVLILPFLGFCH
jgi:hypothetical protein